jgi:hypothetical protein
VEKTANDEPHYLYSSPIINRMMKSRTVRLAENLACIGEEKEEEEKNTYSSLVRKSEGRRPLGRPTHR